MNSGLVRREIPPASSIRNLDNIGDVTDENLMARARTTVSRNGLTNLERVSSHVTAPATPILEEV